MKRLSRFLLASAMLPLVALGFVLALVLHCIVIGYEGGRDRIDALMQELTERPKS